MSRVLYQGEAAEEEAGPGTEAVSRPGASLAGPGLSSRGC